MRDLLIAFSFFAVLSLPDILARTTKEELNIEEPSPAVLSRCRVWLRAAIARSRAGHALSQPATLNSLPMDAPRT